MAGRQTFRMLMVGKSGPGKSTLARQIIRRMQGRYRHLVFVNRKREFAERCECATRWADLTDIRLLG